MNFYSIERKRGFIYRVGPKCYFLGYKTCKECVDKEILDCFYKYEKLMNEIKDIDYRNVLTTTRNEVADCYNKLIEYGKRYSEYDGNIRSKYDSFMENLTDEQQESLKEQLEKLDKAWLISLDKEIDDYRKTLNCK